MRLHTKFANAILLLCLACGQVKPGGSGGIVDNGHEENEDKKEEKQDSVMPDAISDYAIVTLFDELYSFESKQTDWYLKDKTSEQEVFASRSRDDLLTFTLREHSCLAKLSVTNSKKIPAYRCNDGSVQFEVDANKFIELIHTLDDDDLELLIETFAVKDPV